jgi:MFS family permease
VGSGLGARLSQSLGALADVFRTGDLRRLGLAYLTSLLALWAYGVVISVSAFPLGGATLVGVAAVIRLVPAAVVAPFAATLADRYPRRRVLIVTDLIRAALIAAAAAAVAADLPAAVVFAIAGANAMVGTVFQPAKGAMLPSLAANPEQLTAANTAMSTFESASMFAGPALGGLVLAFGSIQLAFLLIGLLCLLSAAQVVRIRNAAADEIGDTEEPDHWLTEALAGFRVIRADPKLQTMIGLLGAQVMIDGVLTVAIVAVAFDLLGEGEAWVGYLNAAVGIGGLLGAIATLALIGRRGLGAVFGLGLAAWGIPLVVLGVVPGAVAALLLLGVVGVANTVVDSTVNTLLQRVTPKEVLGRVFGVLESVIIAAVAVGSMLAPALIAGFGIEGALIVSGLVLPVLAVLARPALARIDAATSPPTHRLELLRAIPMFAPLGPAPIEGLAARLDEVRHPAGAEIIRQGDHGDRFYVVDRGEVQVFEDGQLIRTQGPGEHFGEIALLRDIPRTATVIAHTDVELLALGRDEFLEAVTRDRLSTQAAEGVVAARLG